MWEGLVRSLLALLTELMPVLLAWKGGRTAAANEQKEQTLESVMAQRQAKLDVDKLPDGAAADRLRERWSRD